MVYKEETREREISQDEVKSQLNKASVQCGRQKGTGGISALIPLGMHGEVLCTFTERAQKSIRAF